jgi:cation diffusion facilitator CzcD-associated flavoprotein CzcO
MAIKLQEAGITDIVILEKKEKLGGTWRENTYPGVACDVPAHMYTYSFAPNPDWSHRYARGNEIQGYFEQVAQRFGIANKIRFNEGVNSCCYDNGKWQLITSLNQKLAVDFVVSATGILHHPAKPDIPGLENFEGSCFHTAEWDHSVQLSGKKVGVIGTGSTAAQVVPQVAQQAAELNVFQRTPHWIIPLPDKIYSDEAKLRLHTLPWLGGMVRQWYMKAFEHTFSKAVIGHKLQHRMMEWLCKRNLKKHISNPILRNKLTPDYKVGCKRLIFSSDYYPAMERSNVSLVTNGIERIEPGGICTSDGEFHELDVLILSTGFKPFNFMRPMDLRGRDGVSIDQQWERKVQAYRSVLIPNFPNFFLMLGPNTPIGNYSVIEMSEVQASYVLKLVDQWRDRQLHTIEASTEAMVRFNQHLRAGMDKTVWVGGCQSWYLDEDGDPAMWPYTWHQWVEEMAEPELGDLVRSDRQPDHDKAVAPKAA